MTPEVKEKIKGKTTEEVRAMIKSKEITIPTDKKESEEFLRYASLPPDKRDVTTEPTQPTAPTAPAPDGNKDDKGDKGDKGSVSDDTTAKWWETMGNYASAEEALEGHKKQKDLIRDLQISIDNINAKEGKRGIRLKSLEEENAILRKERDDWKTKASPEIKKPEKPKRPNPKDFEDGVVDQKYIDAMDAYFTANETYTETLVAYNQQELRKELEAVKASQKSITRDEPAQQSNPQWDRMLNVDIPSFQKKFNIETTIPIRDIHANLNRMTGHGVYGETINDPDSVERAKRFVATIPKKDMDIYEKIRQAVDKAYDFNNPNGPVSRYAKGIEGAIIDHDMLGEGKPFNIVKPSSLTVDEEKKLREEQQRKNAQGNDPVPGDKLASGDSVPSATQTTEEKARRYRSLMTAFNVAMRNGTQAAAIFKASPEFQEMNKLSVELGLSKSGAFTR